MEQVKEFKELLVKLLQEGPTNMGRNQVIDKINTTYATFEILKGQ